MNTTLPNEGMDDGDEYLGVAPPKISKEQLQELSRISNWRGFRAVATEWLCIIAAVWLCEHYWSVPLYLLTAVWIGSRLHAFGVLMHDASHYRLFSNRKINDFVGEVLLAWPVLVTLYGYRRNHFGHHRYLNTERDPDWVRKNKLPEYVFPKTRYEIALILLKYLLGIYAYREAKLALFEAKLSKDLPQSLTQARFAFYGTILISSVYLGVFREMLLYWLVPVFTTFLMLLYIRAVADHFGNFAGGSHANIYTQSRTTYLSKPEGFLLSPYNINYHIEHHFYPSVPFYNLPALHKILLQDPNYQKSAHITHGFVKGLFDECVTFGVPPHLLGKQGNNS